MQYFVVMIDYGRRGREAIVDPEIIRREVVWEAHRTHFYQRATDNGFSVLEIVVRVFVLNLALAGLAIVSAIEPDARVDLATLALGGALVAWLLMTFARSKR